jgi:hypothetical protein
MTKNMGLAYRTGLQSRGKGTGLIAVAQWDPFTTFQWGAFRTFDRVSTAKTKGHSKNDKKKDWQVYF